MAFANQDRVADSYLVIHEGPIVAMIEGFRNGLLWKLFMADPDIQWGPEAARLFKPGDQLT